MLLGEVAAPELPAVAALLGAAVLGLVWLMATGALSVWRRSLGKLLTWLADTIDGVSFSIPHVTTIKPLAPLAAALRALVSTVDHYLGEAVQWSEKGAVTLFKFFTAINVWMAHEIADLASDTVRALAGVQQVTRSQVQAWARTVYGVTIHKLTVAVGTLTHATVPHLAHRIDALASRLAHEAKLRATSIAAEFPRIKTVEHDVTKLGQRVKSIEKKIAAGAAAGLAVAVLAKAVISWLRCPSIKKALTKRSCVDFDYLDGILTGALLIVGTVSLRELTKECQGVTAEASSLIHGFLRDT